MTTIVDTNILLRYFLNDEPHLYLKAKNLFENAAKEKTAIYLDEVVLSETIWVLIKYYKQPKSLVVDQIGKLISQDWINNPRRSFIKKAFFIFSKTNLSFVDCWLFILSQETNYPLETFDQKLKRLKL